MGLNSTPNAERVHIGFFGCRNAGKSSLVNAITNQQISVVSDIKGTTTDPVSKAMELLPLGPVLIIDTPGFDDSGVLGEKRVSATKRILNKCDIAVLVTDASRKLCDVEKQLIKMFTDRGLPYITVKNKCDLTAGNCDDSVSALTGQGIFELKEKLAHLIKSDGEGVKFIGDLINKDDFVVLVTPIDESAPKGRMILPQQQAIRDVLDSDAVAITVKETQLKAALESIGRKPSLVVTDSQAFQTVSEIVPQDIPLTSFSILMARYKGFFSTAVKGARAIDLLNDGDTVLISEGCTHHRQCNDIGTVKMPAWLKNRTAKNLNFEFSSGGSFPDDIEKYALIVHCGACMLNRREVLRRMSYAQSKGVAFTNYGIAIAYMHGILERSIEPIPDLE